MVPWNLTSGVQGFILARVPSVEPEESPLTVAA